MKTYLLNISILFIVTLTLIGCNDECAGCVGCSYEKFTSSAIVEKTTIENDSIILVEFKMENGGYYTVMAWEINKLIKFNKQYLQLKDTKYLIEGEKINKGTCKPYRIDNIQLKQ